MLRFLAATLGLILATGTGAAAVAPADRVSVEALRAHIAVLADDSYQGRKPGTDGGARAEAYVADAFRDAQLRPGAADGGWRQPVSLVRRTPVTASFRLGTVTADAGELALAGEAAEERLEAAPLWFVGAGTPEETAGLDLNGAVLVIADELPNGGHSLGQRRRALRDRGAAGIIIIPPDGAPWRNFSGAHTDRGPALRIDGTIARPAAERLAAMSGRTLDALVASAKDRGFRAFRFPGTATIAATTKLEPFDTANIVGKVAGSDPAAGAVVLSAHWDHVGICRPEGAPDRICNGAVDNASGVAMLIEIARRVAAGPRPVREVYFLATTSEELGLLGAEGFAADPPVPLDRIVAALNIDTAAVAPAGMPVAIMGRGRAPALDRAIDAAIRQAGRQIDSDNEADIMLKRQDGWAFAEKGVPTVMVSGSFSDMNRLMAYLRSNYHGPLDDLAHLPPLDGAAEDATLHVLVARAIADPARYPFPRR